jgi:hypothetical protein
MHLYLKFFITCLIITNISFAQSKRDTVSTTSAPKLIPGKRDTVASTPKKKHGLQHLLGQSGGSAHDGETLINPFFFPGYSPDIQFSLAAGAIISFKTKQSDTLLLRSSAPITVTYSSIKSFIASSGWTTFWLQNRLRINALVQYKVSRDAYYGVGYKSANNTSFPDSTNFWRSFFIFQIRPLWKLENNFFAGVSLEYSSNVLWDENAHMQKDPYYLQYGPHIYNTGIGGILSYDSRDYPQNAYRGIYSTLIYTAYSPGLGGNTNFQSLDFDNRFYIPLTTTKVNTLAINLRSRYEFGQAPITSMISLGTSNDLRGLHFGQFRDYYINYLIAEYRHKIYNRGKPTRFGFVVWSGAGAIGGNFNQAFFQQPLPDLGIGVRYEVQPRLNLRIDVGFAPAPAGNRTGTYFNFQEAY